MLWSAADTMVLITKNRSKSKLPKQQLQIDHVGILACRNAQCCVPWLLAFRAICEAGRKPYFNLACQCHRSPSASLRNFRQAICMAALSAVCPAQSNSFVFASLDKAMDRVWMSITMDGMHMTWNWMGWDGLEWCGLNGMDTYSNIHGMYIWCV